MIHDLLCIRDGIEYAQIELRNANMSAQDIAQNCEFEWQEVNQLIRRLSYLINLLDSIIPGDVENAIHEAIKDYTHQCDLADSQSL